MSFWSSVRDLVGHLKLRWTEFEVVNVAHPVQTEGRPEGKVEPEQRITIARGALLPAGWYMLELEVHANTTRVIGEVVQSRANRRTTEVFKFPIHPGRLCKRLVFVPHRASLSIALPRMADGGRVRQCRLVRTTRRFARDRMLKKLIALHPEYKTSRQRTASEHQSSQASQSIDALWRDYCDVFEGGGDALAYTRWLARFGKPAAGFREYVTSAILNFDAKPLISLVMPVYEPDFRWLDAAIDSVKQQSYQNWELCMADDASKNPLVRERLLAYAAQDCRIKVTFRNSNGHISAASNSALELAFGDWIALLDQDDLLGHEALYWVADAINANRHARLIYSDEDKIDESGLRFEPNFKSNWNPDLFLSQNMISHLGVYCANLLREIGGFRVGFEGSQDYDLALRCVERIGADQIHHIPRVLYHWRVHANSTAYSSEVKPYAILAGERALNDHLARTGKRAVAAAVNFGYRVRYRLPDELPLASIIIPSRNAHKLLSACIRSIVEKTRYARYEIIVIDNGSDDAATLKYFDSLSGNALVRLHRDGRPFNFSQLNNEAVKIANGSFVCLLNDDIEVIEPDWLTELISHALRPEVGVVGAKLLYPDGSVQHGGVVLGTDGVAGHAHRFEKRESGGYCGRAALIQCFSAVTGACLVIRKSLYETLGGLNEDDLAVSGNDVDLCLRAHKAGYRNVWTPYAELFHHESASRGSDESAPNKPRALKEASYMRAKWADLIESDPFYNPNLTLDDEGFGLAWPPRIRSSNVQNRAHAEATSGSH